MKLRTKLVFAVIVIAAIFLTSVVTGCGTQKYGCPTGEGRVPGKFNK